MAQDQLANFKLRAWVQNGSLPIQRCAEHRSLEPVESGGILRCSCPSTVYESDGSHHTAVFNLSALDSDSMVNFTFLCRSTCPGKERRNLLLFFTLEDR